VIRIAFLIALALAAAGCGKRAPLDPPPGASDNAPQLPAAKPFPQPIGGSLPTPTSTPGQQR